VPRVEGLPFDQAASTLTDAGFEVVREDVESNQPADTVVAQSPAGGETAPRGSTVTVQVSTGPTTSTVPDVIGFDEESARQTIEGSGFRPSSQRVDTLDPCEDGQVVDQDPPGNTEAEAGSTVTIFVGRYRGPDVCE
jgi:serine/threonine-protein kinase